MESDGFKKIKTKECFYCWARKASEEFIAKSKHEQKAITDDDSELTDCKIKEEQDDE